MKRDTFAAYVAIVVLAAIWGYNWVAIKVATDAADAVLVAAIRSSAASVCLFGALIATRRSVRPTPVLPTLILGLLQTTFFTLLQVFAVALGGAGKTAILVFTMPFWVVLMAWPLLGERVSRNGWIALMLAAVGLVLVLAPLDVTSGLVSKAAAICSAIVWAASAVYGKLLRAGRAIDLLSLTTWQMFWGSIPLAFLAALAPHAPIAVSLPFILAIAYVALAGTALAWLLWMFILSRLDAGVAGVASLLTPVIGVFAAWLQLGERPGSLELAGLASIIAALVANLLPQRSGSARSVPAPVRQNEPERTTYW